jgi:nucleotide-binding universal stress UspA family protein
MQQALFGKPCKAKFGNTAMKKIIVPTDFSTLSRSAALYAIDLASKTNGRVMIVSVIEIEQGSSQLMNWKKLQDQMEKDTTRQSVKFMEELRGYAGDVSVSYTTVMGGPIEDKIVEFAKQNNADLIVTGTRGASGMKAVVFGSNTAALINKSDIPVIAVPGDIKFNGFDRIVLASDMENLDNEAKAVVEFAKRFDVQIDILHVTNFQHDPRRHDELQEILRRMTGHKHLDIHLTSNENVVKALNDYVQEHDTDLLVMFTHELSLFEKLFRKGHTREMAFHSQVPLLAMKKAG